jgi:hypothetical protein
MLTDERLNTICIESNHYYQHTGSQEEKTQQPSISNAKLRNCLTLIILSVSLHDVHDILRELLVNQWATLCFTLLGSRETWPPEVVKHDLFMHVMKNEIHEKIEDYAPDKNRKNTHLQHTPTHTW